MLLICLVLRGTSNRPIARSLQRLSVSASTRLLHPVPHDGTHTHISVVKPMPASLQRPSATVCIVVVARRGGAGPWFGSHHPPLAPPYHACMRYPSRDSFANVNDLPILAMFLDLCCVCWSSSNILCPLTPHIFSRPPAGLESLSHHTLQPFSEYSHLTRDHALPLYACVIPHYARFLQAQRERHTSCFTLLHPSTMHYAISLVWDPAGRRGPSYGHKSATQIAQSQKRTHHALDSHQPMS